jgi:hypothetical protein
VVCLTTNPHHSCGALRLVSLLCCSAAVLLCPAFRGGRRSSVSVSVSMSAAFAYACVCRRASRASVLLSLWLAVAVAPAAVAAGAVSGFTSTVFNTAGGPFTFTVSGAPPLGLIGVRMWGGSGGGCAANTGGAGAFVFGNFTTTPGEVITVYVGGAGVGSATSAVRTHTVSAEGVCFACRRVQAIHRSD